MQVIGGEAGPEAFGQLGAAWYSTRVESSPSFVRRTRSWDFTIIGTVTSAHAAKMAPTSRPVNIHVLFHEI